MSLAQPQLAGLVAALLAAVLGWLAWRVAALPLAPARKSVMIALNLAYGVGLWGLLVQPTGLSVHQAVIHLHTPPAGEHRRAGRDAIALPSLDGYPLLSHPARPSRVVVTGQGLPLSQWPVDRVTLEPALDPLPAGAVAVAWPDHLAPGEELTVTGRLEGLPGATVALAQEGVIQASVVPEADGRFAVSVVPKVSGRLLYRLVVNGPGGETLLAEPVPVRVQQPRGLRVQIALSAPSFEAAALQRWLAESAAGLRADIDLGPAVARQVVSGDAPGASAWRSRPETVDLLVADADWLNRLDDAATRLLRSAVAGGLGLLVLADAGLAGRSSPLLADFRWTPAESGAPTDIGSGESVTPTTVKTDAPALITDAAGRTLVAGWPEGLGRITVSLMAASYPLQRTAQFAPLWQRIVKATARPESPGLWVESPLPAMRHREWVWLCDADGCQRSTLTGAGWQRLERGGRSIWMYAYEPGDWRAWRAEALARNTRLAAQLARPDTATDPVPAPFNPWPWLALTVLGGALAWLEQRSR